MRSNEFYCVKCKSQRMCHDNHISVVTMKNKRPALKAKCPSCSTKVFKFMKMSDESKMRSRFRSAKMSKSRSKKRSGSKKTFKRRTRSMRQ